VTRTEILDYEVRASWWACWCPWHALAATYFAWKVRRKWRRYEGSLMNSKWLKARQP
jgi:hypothetical protein